MSGQPFAGSMSGLTSNMNELTGDPSHNQDDSADDGNQDDDAFDDSHIAGPNNKRFIQGGRSWPIDCCW